MHIARLPQRSPFCPRSKRNMALNWNSTPNILTKCWALQLCAKRWNVVNPRIKSSLIISPASTPLPNCARRICCITDMRAKSRLFLAAVWFLVPAQLLAGAFRADKLSEMDAAINDAIAQHKCPGGVLWLEHNGEVYKKAYGSRAVVPAIEPMTEDTIFDAASLTKVVATTPAILLLAERGQIKLDEPVCSYLPEFKGEGRELVTVRELMTLTSGLPEDIETKSDWHG